MNENHTTFIDVICNHAMVEIADIRLQTEMGISPAQFFRKMSLFVINAVPRFNRPPEAREWLKFTAPNYDDMKYIVPTEYRGGNLTIQTDKIGYDMCSVVRKTDDGYGEYNYTPVVGIEYDKETGDIEIAEEYVDIGDVLEIDFYTDGVFDRELGWDMKDILGLLIHYVWEFRFANDYLLQQPKIKDRSFDVGNEANHMRASTERMRFLSERINQRLKLFEQRVAYKNVVLDGNSSIAYEPENS